MDLSGAVVPKPKNKGGAPKGRVISEATREALKKGFEALKAKREAIKKDKEAKKEVIKQEVVMNEVKNSNEPVAPVVPLETPTPIKPKRDRMKTVSKNEFITFKDDILQAIDKRFAPPVINEPKISAPITPVVEIAPPPVEVKVSPIERVVSGNELLNKIFFKM
jgi:hypothetical protein